VILEIMAIVTDVMIEIGTEIIEIDMEETTETGSGVSVSNNQSVQLLKYITSEIAVVAMTTEIEIDIIETTETETGTTAAIDVMTAVIVTTTGDSSLTTNPSLARCMMAAYLPSRTLVLL
jgi:hypothetical protein